MFFEVNLPSLSPTMEEGKIVKWVKKEKDPILSGEVLFEVETDKATMEYESPEDGFIAKILTREGDIAKVNELVAIISDNKNVEESEIDKFIKENNINSVEVKNLSETKVTDRGLRSIAAIKSLKEIYLWGSNVTEDGVAFLQKELPDAKIIFNFLGPR